MRSRTMFVVAVLWGLLAAWAALPAAAARIPNCFGLEPTAGHLGTSGNDTIIGTAGDDVIVGLGGDDRIYGNGGRDRICGGEGNDRIFGGPGGDLLDGEGGNDRVYGQGGNDGFVLGGDGRDVLSPGAGSFNYVGTVEGGAGRDRIVIDRKGVNDIWGGPGLDTLDVRKAPVGMNVDFRWGHFIDATLTGEIGYFIYQVEVVYGSEYDDSLWGNSRENWLWGYGGDDLIHGRGGDDYLWGGKGLGDWLEGDDGFDTCWDPDGFIVMDECEA